MISLPGVHDRIDHGNVGTITSWSNVVDNNIYQVLATCDVINKVPLNDNDNMHHVLVRSTMYDKVVSNVKNKQKGLRVRMQWLRMWNHAMPMVMMD